MILANHLYLHFAFLILISKSPSFFLKIHLVHFYSAFHSFFSFSNSNIYFSRLILFYLKYSSALFETSLSLILKCFLKKLSASSHWFDTKYVFRRANRRPLINLRLKSLRYIPLNVKNFRLLLCFPKHSNPQQASVKQSFKYQIHSYSAFP